MIANRVCEGGGWNYGNASVIGQDLRPYVPSTAIALVALQDRRAVPAVNSSLAWLSGARSSEPSATALALAAIGLGVNGIEANDVEARLAGDLDRVERIGNLQAMAMMLYVLTADRHRMAAFRHSSAAL